MGVHQATCPVAFKVPKLHLEAAVLPRPWQTLPEDRRRQLAKVVADLLWRMRPTNRRTAKDEPSC